MKIHHLTGDCEVRFVSPSGLGALPSTAFWVTDDNVRAAWPHLASPQSFSIRPGELSKSLERFGQITEWLAGSGARRSDTLIAFGGGVVGDLAGFAAATYMRGIRLISLPTTLMAQVDSSIGGKVGINLPQGKNLVGAFHPPSEVWICRDFLSTLPEREFRSGLAEVVKYGCIAEPQILNWLDRPIAASSSALSDLIELCVRLKAQIVEQDEFERSGERAKLNFGHTIGHAIENVAGYGSLLHGEAVAIGMVAEASLGERLGVTPKGTSERLRLLLNAQGLPIALDPGWDRHGLLEAIRVDKKSSAEGHRMSLITALGECKLMAGIDDDLILATLDEL